jgi:poly-gamma-glutamate synthesis protein (capsule biosynthesis protein)
MGAVASLMHGGDLRIINLECAITPSEARWSGAPKAFYFGAPPEAFSIVESLGVDLVNLANNHALDMDVQGLLDTLEGLEQRGIAVAGAGRNLNDALKPAIVERGGLRFGMAGFCDHQEDFAAGEHLPGIAYLDLRDVDGTLEAFAKGLEQIGDVDIPILSLHWGPNMVDSPSPYFQKLAHAAIDLGYKILFGHSAHVFHGIEVYKGCPILYAAGDFVDDYAVDPYFRNDHQVLIELEFEGTDLIGISLYPLLIGDCRVELAKGEDFTWIERRARRLFQPFGLRIEAQGDEKLVADW